MFYFLLEPIMMYNWILILSAVIPAVFLMVKVYRSDRIEKESGYLLRKLVVAGIISTLLALVEEKVGEWLLSCFVPENTWLYQIILYFVIVAIAEESSKYMLGISTNPVTTRDRKSTRLNSSHEWISRMPSSA